MSNLKIRINLPFLEKKIGFYVLCIFHFLLPENEKNDSLFHIQTICSSMRGLPTALEFSLQMIRPESKLGLFLVWSRELGSADFQHKASLFRSYCWQSCKLLFLWALGNSQLVVCSLMDTVKRQSGLFSPSPGQEFRIFASCLQLSH